jgi:hypothetical protein
MLGSFECTYVNNLYCGYGLARKSVYTLNDVFMRIKSARTSLPEVILLFISAYRVIVMKAGTNKGLNCLEGQKVTTGNRFGKEKSQKYRVCFLMAGRKFLLGNINPLVM